MNEQVYKKVGKRYVPIGYSDGWSGFPAEGLWAVHNKPEDKAKEYAEGLMETWNQYLSGDVWGFIVEKPNTTYSISKERFESLGNIPLSELVNNFDIEDEWEEVESVWGYYGDPEEFGLLTEAKLVIDNYEKIYEWYKNLSETKIKVKEYNINYSVISENSFLNQKSEYAKLESLLDSLFKFFSRKK